MLFRRIDIGVDSYVYVQQQYIPWLAFTLFALKFNRSSCEYVYIFLWYVERIGWHEFGECGANGGFKPI